MSAFRISDNFLEEYKGKQPEWGPVGYFIFKRTYARFIENENRTEEFWETLKRVVEGTFLLQKKHCLSLGLPWNQSSAQKSAQKMFDKMWNFKFLPAGRGLWMMGTKFIEKHGSAALNSCSLVSTSDINIKGTKPFEFAMDMLMLGVGVGFDTKGSGKIIIKFPKGYDKNNRYVFKIPDSREGWVEALKILLSSFFYGKPYPKFDFSEIREAGLPIKGFGGISSGSKPLQLMLSSISDLLMDKIGDTLTSVDITDIMDLIGKCVVSGNVRRSALISLGDPTDKEFIEMKEPEKHSKELEDFRWASNNSIFAEIGMNYHDVAKKIIKNGEPGIVWLENAKNYSRMDGEPDYKDTLVMGVNPCSEQSLESYELCNLVETYPVKHSSYKEYEETLKYAFMYAKSVTLLNTNWSEVNAVMLKNRRIGISQSGIIDAFKKFGRRKMLDWCEKGYKYIIEKDKQYSDWLVTPRSKKYTTVKPSGTNSLLVGVSPGIHYPHSEYYIRRVRIKNNSSLLQPLIDAGYEIEDDLYSPETKVISFPIYEKYFIKGKNDVSIWEQMENAANYQRYWADNQVSITVTFKKEEEDDIETVLECFEDKLKGVSFLPIKDHGYKQPPYEEITEKRYNEMVSVLKPLKLNKSIDKSKGDKYCSNDTCAL